MLSFVSALFGSATKLVGIGTPSDDSLTDRLNHNWTTFLLTLFSLVVTTTQFAGQPIHCAIGKDHEGWKSYINSFCWIRNTYIAPMEEILPVEEKERKMAEIKYYQWVPVILLLQALMFKLPHMMWQMLGSTVGLNLKKIIVMAGTTQYDPPKERAITISNIASYIHSWLLFERERHYSVYARMRNRMSRLSIIFFPIGYRNGTYLVGVYFFSKWLYILNIIGQFFLMDVLLGFPFSSYGHETFMGLVSSGELQESAAFPKVTYCDIQVRQQANVNTFTFQCVLSVNMISERLFAILWFWFVFLAVANLASLLRFGYKLVYRRNRVMYVDRFLGKFVDVKENKKICRRFVDEFIRDDGVLVLRTVADNSSNMVLEDLVEQLWLRYTQHLETVNERRKREKAEAMEIEVIANGDGKAETRLRKCSAL